MCISKNVFFAAQKVSITDTAVNTRVKNKVLRVCLAFNFQDLNLQPHSYIGLAQLTCNLSCIRTHP